MSQATRFLLFNEVQLLVLIVRGQHQLGKQLRELCQVHRTITQVLVQEPVLLYTNKKTTKEMCLQ